MQHEGIHQGGQGINVFPFLLLLALGTVLLLGRALLAFLPPGRVGSHRVQDLAETLLASCLLGGWLLVLLSFVEGPLPRWMHEEVLFAGLALVALLRLALRPHALVPQHELPRPAWGWLESSLVLALGVAALWPLQDLRELGSLSSLERLARAAVIVMAGSSLARAVECAGRPTAIGLGVALAVLAPNSPLGPSRDGELLVPLVLSLLAATSLSGWLRRADPRDRALALFASGALAGFDVRLGAAGILATLLPTHPNARKSTVRAALLALILVALPTAVLGREERGGSESDLWSLEGWNGGERLGLPLGLVAALVLASLIVRARAPKAAAPGRFAPPGREVTALALFCTLPLALAGLELALPSLALPQVAPLELAALARLVAPAAVFLAAITLVPLRKP